MVALRFVVLAALLVLLTVRAQKAPRFKACKRSQAVPKRNECIRDALQKAIPEMVKGLPEYGLKTIDPLRIDSMDIGRGKGAVSMDIGFRKLDIKGFSQLKVKSLEVDVEHYRMSGKLEVDGNVYLQGNYIVDGKVLILPITGKGKCNITLVNPKIDLVQLSAKAIKKGGKTYVTMDTLKFVVTKLDRVHFDLRNLFNGNKALGDNMNAVMNDNWEQMFQELQGPVASGLALAFKDVFNRILPKVPYEHIFP